jgi:Mn-dependent DtxR family transcriptional regulator
MPHTWHKLTVAEVKSIRERHAAGAATQQQLAAEFHVSQKTVSEIVNYLSRASLK